MPSFLIVSEHQFLVNELSVLRMYNDDYTENFTAITGQYLFALSALFNVLFPRHHFTFSLCTKINHHSAENHWMEDPRKEVQLSAEPAMTVCRNKSLIVYSTISNVS